MKILNITFKMKVNCSANVCLRNHWDGDHLNYVHQGFLQKLILVHFHMLLKKFSSHPYYYYYTVVHIESIYNAG